MDQPPNFRRRRIAFVTAAVALLALSNRPDPTIDVVAIDLNDGAAPTITRDSVPLATGVAMLASWASERLIR